MPRDDWPEGPEEGSEEDLARFFVQTWAETVLEQLEVARAARNAHRTADRYAERGDPELPQDFLESVVSDRFRRMWTAEHMLVWSAHQLEQWHARLAKARRKKRPKPDARLAHLRGALEHLDEADLIDGYAVAKPEGNKKTSSLRKLPNGRILIGRGSRLLFGNISAKEIEERALAVFNSVKAELDSEFEARVDEAEDRMIQLAVDEQRGK